LTCLTVVPDYNENLYSPQMVEMTNVLFCFVLYSSVRQFLLCGRPMAALPVLSSSRPSAPYGLITRKQRNVKKLLERYQGHEQPTYQFFTSKSHRSES